MARARIELADAPRRNPRIQRMAKGASEESSDTGNDDAPEVAVQVIDGRVEDERHIFHGIKTKAYGHADRGGLVGLLHVSKSRNNNNDAKELDGFFWKRRVKGRVQIGKPQFVRNPHHLVVEVNHHRLGERTPEDALPHRPRPEPQESQPERQAHADERTDEPNLGKPAIGQEEAGDYKAESDR